MVTSNTPGYFGLGGNGEGVDLTRFRKPEAGLLNPLTLAGLYGLVGSFRGNTMGGLVAGAQLGGQFQRNALAREKDAREKEKYERAKAQSEAASGVFRDYMGAGVGGDDPGGPGPGAAVPDYNVIAQELMARGASPELAMKYAGMAHQQRQFDMQQQQFAAQQEQNRQVNARGWASIAMQKAQIANQKEAFELQLRKLEQQMQQQGETNRLARFNAGLTLFKTAEKDLQPFEDQFSNAAQIYNLLDTESDAPPSKAELNAAITKFAKILDPTSAVLTGERQQVVEGIQSYFSQLKQDFNEMFSDESALSASARRNLAKTVEQILDAVGEIRDRRFEGYRKQFQHLRARPDIWLTPLDVPMPVRPMTLGGPPPNTVPMQ